MEHPDFGIDPFAQSKTDFVLWATIGHNALPVGVNQRRKLSIRLQALPPQTVLLAFEKDPGTPFGAVVPTLAEGFLEEVGRIQPPVSLQQFFQRPPAIQTEVLAS